MVFRGADSGHLNGHDGRVRFGRSLPAAQLGRAGALLAYAMNGEELPAAHGYPLRLVVPGWYAVAPVKWLTGIQLTGRPFRGHFRAGRYHIYGGPLSPLRVRSLITEPAQDGTAGPTIALLPRLAAALDADVRLTPGHDLGSVGFETHAA